MAKLLFQPRFFFKKRSIWEFFPISFLIITSSVWCPSYLLLLRVVFYYIDWPPKYLHLQFTKERGNFHWHQTFRLFIAFLFGSGHLFFIFFKEDYFLIFWMLHRCSQYYLHILLAYALICKKVHLKKKINEDHVNKLQYRKTKFNFKFQIPTF